MKRQRKEVSQGLSQQRHRANAHGRRGFVRRARVSKPDDETPNTSWRQLEARINRRGLAAPLPLLGSAAILLVWPLRVWPGLLRAWTVLLSWACLRSRHLLAILKQAQFELQGAAAGGLGWGYGVLRSSIDSLVQDQAG